MDKENKISNILIGILYFILGVVLIAATNELIKTFNYILVSISAIIGVVGMINFFMKKKYKDNNYIELLVAVLFIWISLVLYIYYGFMIIILPMLFSLYLFMLAVLMLLKYLSDKNKKYLVLFLMAIIIGLLLIFNPGSTIFNYLKVTGIYLIVVSMIYFSSLFKKENNK